MDEERVTGGEQLPLFDSEEARARDLLSSRIGL
jgi:hypothetical protein